MGGIAEALRAETWERLTTTPTSRADEVFRETVNHDSFPMDAVFPGVFAPEPSAGQDRPAYLGGNLKATGLSCEAMYSN
ncbi:hypothetical protein SKAU_G00044110 [Synaphobranchus kaupii]|uniref:Uncharacterized protein n=1 Tax=Synaphobranchus kaupii TaxID=118154 RepID=A0A9Q1J811_SYNKA|nr:hypothetical protein SKAU_G00044110 [Synaphobranchus kaupii]